MLNRLLKGRTVDEVASHFFASRTWVYRLCKLYGWPRNPPLTTTRRAQVVAASRHLKESELAVAFSYAPLLIKRILRDSDQESRRTLRVARP